MTLNDLIDITQKMEIDPDAPLEILWPNDRGNWEFTSRFGIYKAKDGGFYITPESVSTVGS